MPYRSLIPSDLFHCKKCGDCCKGYGGTYVTEADIRQISDYLDIKASTFAEKYCIKSGGRQVIGQGKDMFCHFYDGICTIHPVKPKMCRAWPFIDAVLKDVSNWHIMAGACPGIRTDIPDDLVLKMIGKVLDKGL